MSPLIQIPVSLGNNLTDLSRNNAFPTGHLSNVVKLTPKISHHKAERKGTGGDCDYSVNYCSRSKKSFTI